MGADIYLNSVFNPNRKKWERIFDQAVTARDHAKKSGADNVTVALIQAKVSAAHSKMYEVGYFRDSYNGTSLFGVLELSWWRDVIPMLKGGDLPIEAAKKLRRMVEDAPMRPITRAWLEENHCEVDDGENSPETWKKYFEKKRERLLDLLDQSIALNEPLECSL